MLCGLEHIVPCLLQLRFSENLHSLRFLTITTKCKANPNNRLPRDKYRPWSSNVSFNPEQQ